MKKILCIIIITYFSSLFAFSEILHGVTTLIGYHNNVFTYEGLKYNACSIDLLGGYSVEYYPNYGSILGFALAVDTGPCISIYEHISDSNILKTNRYVNKKRDLNFGWDISTDIGINFRIPIKDLNSKTFSYIRLGGMYRALSLDVNTSDNKNTIRSEFDWQQTISAFAEIGRFTTNCGEISLRFAYAFLESTKMTNNNFIMPKSFGILFSWKPYMWRTEFSSDRAWIKKNTEKQLLETRNENVYSNKYRLFRTESVTISNILSNEEANKLLEKYKNQIDEDFFSFNLTGLYYRRIDDFDQKNWLSNSDPFIREITFIKHTKSEEENYNSKGKETEPLPFYTYEDKEKALEMIITEYEYRKEQKKIETEQQLVAKEEHAAIYAKILATKQPAKLVEYIYGYRETEFFNENVYLDIARIISNNKNITLTNLPNINNPYNLDKKTIYYANTIQVIQWTGNGTFLAETDTGDYIFIRNVYDISQINDVIQNTYLKYQGTYEYNSVGQGYKVVPEFDLLYNFDGPEM